ncbi:MAG: PAS domain S-box protein [Nitrospira sp.]|nr:PAS domain S-box protein [Nitrospira sp.]
MLTLRSLRHSLTHKMMALFFAVFFSAVCGLSYFAYTSSRKAMFQEFEIRGRMLAKTIASQSKGYFQMRDVDRLTSLLHSLGEGEDVVAVLAYHPSKSIWVEFSSIQLTLDDLNLPAPTTVWQRDISLKKGYRISEFGRAVSDSPHQIDGNGSESVIPVGWVRVFLDRNAIEQRLTSLLVQTLLTGLLTTMIGGTAFILLLRRSLHVIGPLTEATKKVAGGDLQVTIPVSTKDELGELATCFNSMTEQLLQTTVSKNYVDHVIRSMTDLLIVFNPDRTIRSVNHAALHLLGYEERELMGQDVAILFPEGDNPLSGRKYGELLTHGSIHPIATTYVAKDDRPIPVVLSAATMPDEAGAVQGIACVAKDMTVMRQEEEQLRLQGTALESAANAVMIIAKSGRITWVNPAFTTLTGYSSNDVIDQNIRTLRSERKEQAFYENQWKTIITGRVWHGEVTNRRKDGSIYTAEETITPVRNQDGTISHFISIKQDVTKRKQAVESVQDAHQKLKALDHLRSQFFADISHELRTPLTVIRGEAEVTLRGKEKPLSEYRTTLQRIVQLSNQMNKLVGDILFLARSESGALQMDLKPTSLLDILDEVCRETNVLAQSRGMTATLEEESSDVIIHADGERLKQLLMILTDNAIKYGRPRGSIAIRMTATPVETTLTVVDDGLGIPAEDLPHVFERAYRVWRGRPSSVGGAGLGLPIAKWIAEAHHGTISITSLVNRGTTVTVRLPLHQSVESQSGDDQSHPPIFSGRR